MRTLSDTGVQYPDVVRMLNLEEVGSINVDGGVVPRFRRGAFVAVQRRHKLVTRGSQAFIITFKYANMSQNLSNKTEIIKSWQVNND